MESGGGGRCLFCCCLFLFRGRGVFGSVAPSPMAPVSLERECDAGIKVLTVQRRRFCVSQSMAFPHEDRFLLHDWSP